MVRFCIFQVSEAVCTKCTTRLLSDQHSGIFLEYSGIIPRGKFTVYAECRNEAGNAIFSFHFTQITEIIYIYIYVSLQLRMQIQTPILLSAT